MRVLIGVLVALATLSRGADGQGHPRSQAPPPPKAQVMVLGTYHFDNPNRDYVKSDLDDHRSARRQREIAKVVERLASFAPTKIALESADAAALAAKYEAYMAGTYTLGGDERDQLGLRLARRLGHPRVYAVDHKLDMDLERVVAAAKETQNRAFLAAFEHAIAEIEVRQKRLASLTVDQALAEMNEPDEMASTRDLYMQLARVRLPDAFVGADVLASWYQRNFRIFANLVELIEPDDRVLVIFGAGHAPYLRELVQSCADMRLVEPNAFLRAAR